MIGSIFVPLLLLTCLAEGMAQGHPRRAARLKHLRQIIVMAWALWTVQHNWSSTSLPPWLVFDNLVGTRLFLIAFLGVLFWLVAIGLLANKSAQSRAFLITANTVVAMVFALIVGAAIDWPASSPFVLVFFLIQLAVFASVTWKLADTDSRKPSEHAEHLETSRSGSSVTSDC